MLETVKYRQVERWLRCELARPQYEISDKLPTEKALAKSLNVGQVTIRSALKRLEMSGVIACVHGKGRFLLKKPDMQDQPRSGMNFGLFVLNDHLSFSNDILQLARGLADGLHRWNASLAILPVFRELSELDAVKRILARNVIDGLFLTGMRESDAILQHLTAVHFPCVVFHCMETEPRVDGLAPRVELWEKRNLNELAARFRRIRVLVEKREGAPLRRTLGLLDGTIPAEAQVISPETAENDLVRLIKTLRNDELLVISDLALLPLFDLIAGRFMEREFWDNVLIFNHHAIDIDRYEKRYLVFERPVGRVGEICADIMRKLVFNQNSKQALAIDPRMGVDACVRPATVNRITGTFY